jgi:hypothetical protein
MLQLPLVVGKCVDYRTQAGDVSAQSLRWAVDVVGDELAKVVESMLVAPCEVRP